MAAPQSLGSSLLLVDLEPLGFGIGSELIPFLLQPCVLAAQASTKLMSGASARRTVGRTLDIFDVSGQDVVLQSLAQLASIGNHTLGACLAAAPLSAVWVLQDRRLATFPYRGILQQLQGKDVDIDSDRITLKHAQCCSIGV